ncbi:glycosyltransferase family 1 protein [Myriangium duriaei CBS 260.36]|uniref:Glycosyltransferase family 1 protein n=1 Tax=Myriangium duriaei CBS 260.36 TaxID=1168546 RepID=A0A9P4J7W8_9PEZI|nr:glycosyltransferase family 1 protein [Myriangium duriaei CBS 260.36]
MRAPYSFRFFDHPETQNSSSSEDEHEGEAPSKSISKTSSFGKPSAKREGKQTSREESYRHLNLKNDQYQSKSRVSRTDGRLRISINERANRGRVAKWLGKSIRNHFDIAQKTTIDRLGQRTSDQQDDEAERIAKSLRDNIPKPRLNIVIMVIGSRGDIQPFLRIGQVLRDRGHRVRIATHPAFRDFVQNDIGLEFFSVGGDPSELMAFMVKNPGLIPSFETVRQGEVAKRRAAMAEMFEGFWRSCINATDDENDKSNAQMMGDKHPFVADAIIANPPSFAHVHIAERLGIPLHIAFTFPYSPTTAFPHPLANIKTSGANVDANYVNFMSYALVEMMTWQGLGDLINRFRVRTLGLEAVNHLWASGNLWRMQVAHCYMWSDSLVPKPKDWGPEIDITGFTFLDLASTFQPPDDLKRFLDSGEAPVYIGFGSIVVDDPDKFTELIFEAVKISGVRALISKGWGGIGGDAGKPDNVLMLDNTPHDWLFPKCRAVVHHGGAGTTAIGLKCGKPTVIVPFFGDQPFWGAMVADHKAGADSSIPYKHLTAERLAEAIKQCLTEEARDNAQRIADSIAREGDGAENAVQAFERHLPLAGHHNIRCSILEERVAVWRLKHSNLRLSALAAEILVEERKIKWSQLQLVRHYEYNDFDGPGEPISGIGGAIAHAAYGFGSGFSEIPSNMREHIKMNRSPEHRITKRRDGKRMKKAAASEASAEKNGEVAPDEVAAQESQVYAETADCHGSSQSPPYVSVSGAENPQRSLALDLAEDAGLGLQNSFGALFWAPLDVNLAMAQGLHNVPRLYGDSTVRKPLRISGIKSGMKAARNEFCFGIYDGLSGLVLQPAKGVRDADGVPASIAGFWTGIGKGIGGVVFKPISAVVSLPAFTGQGLRKEIQKRTNGHVSRANIWIRRAQIIQGQKDLNALKKGEDGEEEVSVVWKRVDDGWETMAKVWAAAADYRKTNGKLMGAVMVRHERKKWERAGALENVTATKDALRSAKSKKELRRFFAERKREMEIADQPQGLAETKAANPDTGDVR